MKYDFIVIGAGVSGMASAIVLAKAGYRVGLVEKSHKIAPLIRGFKRKGIYFDTGFHYTGGLGKNEVLDLYFNYLGISDKIEKIPLNEDGFDLFRCLKPEFEFSFPCGYEQIRERLDYAFPGEAKAVDGYLKAVLETSNAFPFINLEKEISLGQSLHNIHGPSLKDVLDSLTDNDLLKATLSIHCLLLGSQPDEIPFGVYSCLIGQFYKSSHRIAGGGLALTQALHSVLNELGVKIICGRGVKNIVFSPDVSVSGVILEDGEPLDCSGCISTVHPKSFLNFIPSSIIRPAYRKRLEQLEESYGAYLLYVALDQPIEMLSGRNLLFSSAGDLTGLDINTPVYERPLFIAATDDGTGYIASCPALLTETDPWRDTFTGNRPKEYGRFKAETTEILLKRIEKSFPEIKGKVIHMESATPLSIRDWTNSPQGSAYGVKHKKGQYNPMTITKSGSLFLAGQAVSGSGVIGAVISSFLACGHVIGHGNIQKAITEGG